MSSRFTKIYNANITLSDGTFLDIEVEVDYYEDDSMCVPNIDTNLTHNMDVDSFEGMAEDFHSDIEDAVNEYFTKDACNTENGEQLYFLYDTVTNELELIEDEAEDTQPIIDKALEQIKSDIENGDLTAIEELLKLTELRIVKRYLVEEA